MRRAARSHRMPVMALAVSVVLSSCTFGGGPATNAVCEPGTTEEKPILGPEAQAQALLSLDITT